MNLRKSKGLQICKTKQINKIEGGYLVPSQSSNKKYFVSEHGFDCTCPDCQTRQVTCKHAYAVQFLLQKITINEEGVKVETKRLTYPQAWSAYNKSQETEKQRFMELLNDLTENIEEPDYSFGRPKLSEKDLLFASTLKVYSQFSLRRFMTDLKEAKGKGLIEKKPCFASVGHFIQRKKLTSILRKLIVLSAFPLKSIETSFAVDSSGFRTTKFNDYCREKHGEKKKHKWLKCHIITGTKTNIITGVEVTGEEGADSPQFTPLVKTTAKNGFSIQEVSGDKAYSSRNNHEVVAEIGGKAFIPFKINATGRSGGSALWRKMYHYFCLNQEEFMKHYHLRSNCETTFGMIKAKFNDSIKSKTKTAQENELLLKVLCHNIVVVIHETNELGIKADFGFSQ